MRTMYMLPSEPFLDPSYTRHRLCQLSKDSGQDLEIAAKFTILTITLRCIPLLSIDITQCRQFPVFPTPLAPIDT